MIFKWEKKWKYLQQRRKSKYKNTFRKAKDKVVELQGIPGTSAARDRGKGFNQAMDKYSDLEVIVQQPAGFARAEGMTVMEAISAVNHRININNKKY